MARSMGSDRSWRFDVAPDELWAALGDVDRYRSWWPWLRRFAAGDGFAEHARWDCVVAPPLPYVVRFQVHLEEVVPAEVVRAEICGDIAGRATLTISDAPGGSTARLRSELRPTDPVLQRVAWLSPPIVRWGHDWVLDRGRRQFVERGLTVDDAAP